MNSLKWLAIVVLLFVLAGALQAAAVISANPFHVSLDPTQTTSSTISWSGVSGTVQVTVSVNGGAEEQIYSGSGTSVVYSGIQTPNWYVLTLKQNGTALSWTSVTTQWKPDFQFGFNILPDHVNWFTDANYNRDWVQARLEQDVAMASSFKGTTIRFNVWTHGTYIDGNQSGANKWVFSSELYQIADNIADWLGTVAYDHKVRVLFAFHNSFYHDGHLAGAGLTLSEIQSRTKDWMSVYINAIETHPKARQVVFAYDYQNEVYHKTVDIIDYVRYCIDNVPVPKGKRLLSISFKQGDGINDFVTWWATQLQGRRVDYLSLHFYPDVQSYDTPSQLAGWVDKARAAYHNATVISGECGYKGGGAWPSNEGSGSNTEDNQSSNMVNLATNARNKGVMAQMAWVMTPPYGGGTEPDYNMQYDAHQPKNVIGSLSASANVGTLTNPDAEQASGSQPTGWTASSSTGYTFSRQGPNKSNAATNSYFGRISINNSDGHWGAIQMSPMTVSQIPGVNYNLYLNAYVRSNMWFYTSILEYNAADQFIREQVWTPGAVLLPANTWRSVIYNDTEAMPWVPNLRPDTAKVVIQFVGYGNNQSPGVLDVDGVSATIRAADRVNFARSDFNQSGRVDLADLATLSENWNKTDQAGAYKNHLVHRYTFDGNANDSIGSAHGTLVASNSSFYEWGDGYLWLKNGDSQTNNYSNGGAFVDLPDYLLNNLRNSDGITLEMFFTTTVSHWWSGYLTFGAGDPSDGTSDALAVVSRENNNTIAFWRQEAQYYGWRLYGSSNLDNATHFAVVINNTDNYVALYIDGQLTSERPVASHELPGLKPTDNTYNDTVNYIGRYYNPSDPMLNAKIYALNIYNKPLGDLDIAHSYAAGPDKSCVSPEGDLSGNCSVGMEDLLIMATQWLDD